MQHQYTTFLFARPSAAEGVARILDLAGTLDHYNASRSGEEADAIAMAMDWHAVGHDIAQAMLAERKLFMERPAKESARGKVVKQAS